MITTNTGAKKIEGTDNWRQIFDAHNSSVDAHDETQSDLDYIIKGNSSSVSIAARKFVSVRGSTITGVTDGIYIAAKAIPASTTLDSSYFTAVTGGALNALSDQIGSLSISQKSGSGTITQTLDINAVYLIVCESSNDAYIGLWTVLSGASSIYVHEISKGERLTVTDSDHNFTITNVSGSVNKRCAFVKLYGF